jgi:hypothetical protein
MRMNVRLTARSLRIRWLKKFYAYRSTTFELWLSSTDHLNLRQVIDPANVASLTMQSKLLLFSLVLPRLMKTLIAAFFLNLTLKRTIILET